MRKLESYSSAGELFKSSAMEKKSMNKSDKNRRSDEDDKKEPDDADSEGWEARLGSESSRADIRREESKDKLKKKRKKEEEVRELPPDQNPVDAEWTAKTWLGALDLESVIAAALKPPEPDGSGAAFTYIRSLTRDQVATMLDDARLGGLVRWPPQPSASNPRPVVERRRERVVYRAARRFAD